MECIFLRLIYTNTFEMLLGYVFEKDKATRQTVTDTYIPKFSPRYCNYTSKTPKLECNIYFCQYTKSHTQILNFGVLSKAGKPDQGLRKNVLSLTHSVCGRTAKLFDEFGRKIASQALIGQLHFKRNVFFLFLKLVFTMTIRNRSYNFVYDGG